VAPFDPIRTIFAKFAKALAESWQIHRGSNANGNIIGPSLAEPQSRAAQAAGGLEDRAAIAAPFH
jgi:hypothetical protein